MWNTIRLHGGEVCEPTGDCPASSCLSCTRNRLPEPTKGRPKVVCGTCGRNKLGAANCCSQGGDWYGKCDRRDEDSDSGLNAPYTWDDGYNACHATNAWLDGHDPANVTVHFYDDAACDRVIEEVAPAPLLKRFRVESTGMYKADMCRGAVLKRTGGFYFDLDLKARMDSRKLVANTTTFVSCVEGNRGASEVAGGEPLEFFQAFIAATPNHVIIDQYLEAMVQWYESQPLNKEGRKKRARTAVAAVALPPRWLRAMRAHWMGTEAMGTAFRSVHANLGDDLNTQIWHEVQLSELDEDSRAGVPSQGGEYCDYVVFDQESGEVPFYSRAQGATDYCEGEYQ